MAETDWKTSIKSLKGVVLDMCGVLYDSGEGGGVAIDGSVDAVKRIRASGLQLRFCTNETQATREKFVAKLQRLGFDISVGEVFSPAPAAVAILKERGLRPHLLVHDDVVPEFDGVEKTDPNCVVIGDAADNFSYQNLNDAFRVLIGLEKPVLFSLGRGRYYRETDGLKLDVGAYMKALEYACDVEAEVVGKPAPMFFQSVLTDMGIQPQQALMIGDDLVNDVGGAQRCRMRGVQVRTGKYRSEFPKPKMALPPDTAERLTRDRRIISLKGAGFPRAPSDERHPTVTADFYADNLAEAVDILLRHRGQ